MRWFKHHCDMHTNLKIQELIDKCGSDGYAIWCLCLELMGKEGKKNKIDGQKRWKKGLMKVFEWPDIGKLEKVLTVLAEIRLINSKSLNYGNLHIPKYNELADNWTQKQLRSESAVTSVRIDKSRLDKIRLHYLALKNWKEENLISNDYARIHKAIKNLLLKTKGDIPLALKAMDWVSKQRYCDWTMETVVKKFNTFFNTTLVNTKEYVVPTKKPEYKPIPKESKEKIRHLTKGIGRGVK